MPDIEWNGRFFAHFRAHRVFPLAYNTISTTMHCICNVISVATIWGRTDLVMHIWRLTKGTTVCRMVCARVCV